MKKLTIIILTLIFTTSAFAGSCPMLAKNVEDKINQAQSLKDEGVKAHKAGDHSKSVELLNQALSLFK